MGNLRIIQVIFFLFCWHLTIAQEYPVNKGLNAITPDAIKAQLGFLASDWTEGRMAGEKGAYIASDYIGSMLQLYGIKPGGDYLRGRSLSGEVQNQVRSYFQNFGIIKSVPGNENLFRLKATSGSSAMVTEFANSIDFTVSQYYPPVEVEAPVVFVGYGIKNEKLKHNDFAKIELKGRFVLRISGTPPFVSESLKPDEIIASYRETESYLREMGVAGIIDCPSGTLITGRPDVKDFMTADQSENPPQPYSRPYPRYSLPGKAISGDIIRITVSVRTANELLKGAGITIEDCLLKAEAKQPLPVILLTGKSVYVKTDVITNQVAVRNVIGLIEGKNPDEIIVIGAHYDHMGTRNGYIWNGSDDNASGCVGVLTLAKAFAAAGMKPEKTIVFAFWTAEEEGLLGSRYYINNLTSHIQTIKLNINFDMISRYLSDDNPKGVEMTYTKSFPFLRDITEVNLKKYSIDLEVDYQPSDDPPGGSDHRSFVEAGIPIMRFKPGHREEYHTPGDEVSKANWDIMEKIIMISFTNIWELANTSW
jgi:hypothetical protein